MLSIAQSYNLETMADALISVNWRKMTAARKPRSAVGPDQTQEKSPLALLLRVSTYQTPLMRLEPWLAQETAEIPEIQRLRPIDLFRLQNGHFKPAGGH